MRERKQKSNGPSNTDLVGLARQWIVKTAGKGISHVLMVVLLRPRTTAAIGLALVLLTGVLFWTGKAVGEYREKRHNEWRLQQMTDAVRQADERMRSQLLSKHGEPDAEFRGVFETMREQAERSPVTDNTAESESKP